MALDRLNEIGGEIRSAPHNENYQYLEGKINNANIDLQTQVHDNALDIQELKNTKADKDSSYTKQETDAIITALKGQGHTIQTIKGNHDLIQALNTQVNKHTADIEDLEERKANLSDIQIQIDDQLTQLKGAGYTSQSIKQNYDLIQILKSRLDDMREKPAVENYADLAREYPNPQIGWLVYVKGTENLNERDFYFYTDGLNQVDNGTNYSRWTVSSGSERHSDGLLLVAPVSGNATASINTNLRTATQYRLTYEILENNAYTSGLYLDSTVIDTPILLDTSLGVHTIDFTTMSSITNNIVRLVLVNGYFKAVDLKIKIRSVKTASEVRWYRLTELLVLANETRNGLLSKEDYAKIQRVPVIEGTTIPALQSTINTDITNLNNHVNGVNRKHNAQDINYSGSVIGASQVKQAIDNIQIQVNNIVSTPNDGNVEITQARVDINNTNHASLKARLDTWEKKQHFWYEEKTVSEGASSFTLINTVQPYMKLEIKDTKYGCEWFENINYSRDGQVITIPTLDEELTFRIIAF
ncbi:MAG TPA: hypothetical protein GYA04_01960 [Acholeplasma sp.]|nr:hypothetical protein [Acholeplasma sp.]